MRKLLLSGIFLLNASSLFSQQVRPASSVQIDHELGQLRHLVNVLYVAAHPDDENTRLLAWLVNDQNIRTAYLSLTRGDGGQNILGSEQGAALGYIRTHELMEARKIDGAEQFFTRAIDFGFSKSADETFKHWDIDSLTSDAVWVMRKFRPDVVICRFPPDAQAGHGQHAASAIIAERAFKACGLPTAYPKQLTHYAAWKPTRLMFNAYRFGTRNTTSEDQLKLAVGQYLPSLGLGSGELAGISRSVHKSQGAGTPSTPGVQTEYFKLVAGDTMSQSLFDGIDMSWGRVGRPDIGEDIMDVQDHFNYRHPDAMIPALLAIREKIRSVEDAYWRMEKTAEINKLILDCAGFMAEYTTTQPQATAASTVPATLRVVARSKTPVVVTAIHWIGSDSTMNAKLPFDTLLTLQHNTFIPANTPITQPYWLASPPETPGLYSITNDTLLGLPETPDMLNGALDLLIGNQKITVQIPLSYKKLDPVKGDLVEQLRIVPNAAIAFTSNMIIPQADGSVQTAIKIHAFDDINNGHLLVVNGKAKVLALMTGIHLRALSDTIIPIRINAEQLTDSVNDAVLLGGLSVLDTFYAKALNLIQYSHIPTLQYFTPCSTKVVRKEWNCTAKNIGYVPGAGDLVLPFLQLAGLNVTILADEDFTDPARLAKYDAIVTGVRMVNVQKKSAVWLPSLLQYVKNGGTLLMQYNTLQDLATKDIGPYPFTLSDDRVTDEDAPVTLWHKDSPLLNSPNKITDADFEGWVQERGLYFASKWDSHYDAYFGMHDPGEEPKNGSTLYCAYGKGHYIYTALSFFRQLPAGNTGAIRLFMNMLSAGR
jgi:LmbE family N-acetylglucosaminyl deacetylase